VLRLATRGKIFQAKKMENLPPEENWALFTSLHELLLFIISTNNKFKKIIKL
jgi:hypothetical protein